MMPFVSAMNTRNGQKVDLKQDLRKKMAAGHFTTIPCKPNTASRKLESHFFKGIGAQTNSMVCAKFPVFRTFMNFS